MDSSRRRHAYSSATSAHTFVVVSPSMAAVTARWLEPLLATAIYLGLGVVTTMAAGDQRRQVSYSLAGASCTR